MGEGKMDPWKDESNSSQGSVQSSFSDGSNSFEDNFEPDTQHLPDSEQYLAILESRLERIRRDQDILKQLSEKREACMRELLSTAPQLFYDEEISLDAPVPSSALARAIAPQRAALNQGEIVELVKYDQLVDERDDSLEN